MTELAHASIPMHLVSLTGQSVAASMLDTDPSDDAARVREVDTLAAEDGLASADELDSSLDDRLLQRDLKARLFGSGGPVRIGRYDVRSRIGRGGMGTVYVAHDPELDRKVALKMLRADRKSGRERMLQEARALAKLAHPNVVAVHEVGLHDERVFVAMELVEGETLRAWLEHRPSRTELYGVFIQAARGLHAAHLAGLVHRDFKPDNVLIGRDGRVRVVDFGVAKAADSLDPASEAASLALATTAGPPGLTLTGQLLGTPAYMASEQFLGASVDARTDVFAFCVVLYEALAGQRPFAGDDPASVSCSVLQGHARPLEASDVPAELVTLVRRGLSRSPAERPGSLESLIAALERAAVPVRRKRSRATWWAASMVALGAGGYVAISGPTSVEPPTEPAVAVAIAAPSLEREGEAEAFAAIDAAIDDDTRLAAAEAFLAGFGEGASEVRRAIAHSLAGDVQWRRSCANPLNGLCIEEHPVTDAGSLCATPRRGVITKRPRDAKLVDSAQRHARAAVALAGVSAPADEPSRQAFAEAIARARVQVADEELELHLTLEVPASLDFEGAEALSTSAFVQFYEQLTSDGGRLMRDYAAVKQTGDPAWILVAAARTGMVSETVAAALSRTPVPAAADREAYCQALEPYVDAPAKNVRDAYQYCVSKAEAQGLGDAPIAGFCSSRLELYPDSPAQ